MQRPPAMGQAAVIRFLRIADAKLIHLMSLKGINANLVRRRVKEAEVGTEIELEGAARPCEKAKPATPAVGKFLPVPLPTPVPTAADIHIELQRGGTAITVLAGNCCQRVRGLNARAAAMSRIDAMWLFWAGECVENAMRRFSEGS